MTHCDGLYDITVNGITFRALLEKVPCRRLLQGDMQTSGADVRLLEGDMQDTGSDTRTLEGAF